MVSLANVIAVVLGARASTAFCGGLFDFVLDVMIPGAPNWVIFILVGAVAGVTMYFISVFMIKTFDFKTPGRELNDEQAAGSVLENDIPYEIIKAFGGVKNMKSVGACFTRLRVSVEDVTLVDEAQFKRLGGKGVVSKDNGFQVIFGPQAAQIKDDVWNAMRQMQQINEDN